MSAEDDIETLAEAERIKKDKDRRKEVQSLAKKRKADVFAGQGSVADRLRLRRIALESEDFAGMSKAFEEKK